MKRREVCYSCVESQCGGFVCYSCVEYVVDLYATLVSNLWWICMLLLSYVESVVDLYATLDLCRICGGFCSCLFFLSFVAVVSAMVTLFCLSR